MLAAVEAPMVTLPLLLIYTLAPPVFTVRMPVAVWMLEVDEPMLPVVEFKDMEEPLTVPVVSVMSPEP